MPFVIEEHFIEEEIKTFRFLMHTYQLSMGEAQSWICRRRIFLNGEVHDKRGGTLLGTVGVVRFKGISRGLKPLFSTSDFAIFEKPSGVLVHPSNKKTPYSLMDEVRFHFGDRANITHRIDQETSGLVLVAKHKKAENHLKQAFENREIKKTYLALVKGRLEKELFIDAPIHKKSFEEATIKIKMLIDQAGKPSQTLVKPLKVFDNNTTLVEASPLTGRQHQIRLHLFHVKHPIVGDPLYGVSDDIGIRFLEKNLSEEERVLFTGYKRLMLHAAGLNFHYNNPFSIKATENFYKEVAIVSRETIKRT